MTEHESRIGIAILAKAPVAGLAKTRLIPHLGAEGAAALQGWLLQRAVATAVVADVGPVTLWCAPTVEHAAFATCRAFGDVELRCQPAGDLGARMHAAIAAAPDQAGTLVIGTDCPALTPGLLREAARHLRTHQATVVPAEDGGYVLIGMRKAAPAIFHGVEWSTERVMAQTRVRLAAMNLHWHEFAPLWDVDRKEDFLRLAALLPEELAFARNEEACA